MSNTIDLKIRITFPMIFAIILALHVLSFVIQLSPTHLARKTENEAPRVLNVREIRTVGMKNSPIKDSTYLNKSDVTSPFITKERYSKVPNQSPNTVERPKKLSLSDFADKSPAQAVAQATPPQTRPGTNPGVGQERPKALEAIKLRGSQISQFSKGSDAAAISGDPRAASLSNSDIMVKLEVPEGVSEEELNEYELMYYGFQRRTAIGYINAFYKNLDKFERENPHKRFPLTEDKQVMTGRLIFDQKGNLKQIKMIRWTNVERLQDFFVDVLKDMDTLHNPPKTLWERDKEFAIFFSLIING